MSTGRFEEAPVSETYAGPQIVGLDLHRRRTVMVRLTPSGERLEVARFASDPQVLADQIAKAGAAPRVVLEATYGWYWAADVLAAAGAEVHLAHPLGVKGFAYRRVKNDVRDAADLADLLRMQRLPEAWIAPPPVRAQRELVRHRHKLRQVCSRLKSGAHAVLAKNGVLIARSDMFGIDGRRQLSRLVVPEAFRIRLDSQLRLVDILEDEIADLDNRIAAVFGDDTGDRTVQRIGGIGPVLGAVLRAEIGDITRFRSPARLNSWAGLTRGTANPTPRSIVDRSPSRVRGWSAGPRSRPSSTLRPTPRCATPISGSWRVEARTLATSPGLPPPANCSPVCSTHSAMVMSAAWRRTRGLITPPRGGTNPRYVRDRDGV
jgi:transposase